MLANKIQPYNLPKLQQNTPSSSSIQSKKENRDRFRMIASDHYNKGFDMPAMRLSDRYQQMETDEQGDYSHTINICPQYNAATRDWSIVKTQKFDISQHFLSINQSKSSQKLNQSSNSFMVSSNSNLRTAKQGKNVILLPALNHKATYELPIPQSRPNSQLQVAKKKLKQVVPAPPVNRNVYELPAGFNDTGDDLQSPVNLTIDKSVIKREKQSLLREYDESYKVHGEGSEAEDKQLLKMLRVNNIDSHSPAKPASGKFSDVAVAVIDRRQEEIDHLAGVYNQVQMVMMEINNQSRYEGIKRLQRPPVFLWAQNDIHRDHQVRKSVIMKKGGSEVDNQIEFPTKEESKKRKSSAKLAKDVIQHFTTEEQSGFKNPHQLLDEIDLPEKAENELRVLAVTYNMGGKCPHSFDILDDLFQKDNVDHDIIVLASQEAEKSIQASMIFPDKEKMNKTLMNYLGQPTVQGARNNAMDKDANHNHDDEEFIMVNCVSLCAISLSIFIKKKHVSQLSEIQNDTLATGFGDVMANKGGVAVSFKIQGKRMLFINCHQEAHQGNRTRRNEQWDIIHKRFITDSKKFFDGIIWLGDFNSRTEGHASKSKNKWGELAMRQNIIDNIVKGNYKDLVERDQFYQDTRDKIIVSKKGFLEGDISTFAPTFKLKVEEHTYYKRNPSWTDRIIYKSIQKKGQIPTLTMVNYESNTLVNMSDHRPVFAQFVLMVSSKKQDIIQTNQEAIKKIFRQDKNFGHSAASTTCNIF